MSKDVAGEFADYFPNGCPPDDSAMANGPFYRLVRNEPPDGSDLLNHHERKLRGGDPCERCGLSIFQRQSDATELYRFFARKHGNQGTRIGHFVAGLALKSEHGKLKPTPRRSPPDSHHTWWPFRDVDRLSSFVAVVEDAKDGLDT
jgi:hypothetical protein